MLSRARRQEAQADKAYELQTNVMQQQVIAEQVKVQQIEKEGQIKVQQAEILRHEAELTSTILKGSEVEAKRIQNIAAAEKGPYHDRSGRPRRRHTRRRRSTSRHHASARRSRSQSIIFQKGEAEAKAMNVKAEAYQGWTQAAVVDKLLSSLPEVVRAMSEPLAQVDKITIVSTGSDGNGASHRRKPHHRRHDQNRGAGARVV